MRILIAVDGSKHSDRAERLLGRLCGGRSHRVTVFHATPPVVRGQVVGESITEALKRSGEALARAAAEGLRAGKRLEVGTAVEENADPAGAILDRAEREGARLIVLGARGLTPFKSFLLGSVSQKVSRHFPGSVMIARPGRERKGLRVLACVDGSYGGRRALDFLSELGLPASARLTLVHVADGPLASDLAWKEDPGFVVGGYSAMLDAQKRYRADLRRTGARVLADAKARLGPRRVETLLVDGHPAGEILKSAESLEAELIVMGRRGMSKTERFLMGSVSHKVSAYAPCSVLVVK